jgi:hypothetical protein
MPLLSIIGCDLFKKEIAQVLINDGAIENLVIVNGKDADFEKTLEGAGARVQAVSADSIPTPLKKSEGFNVILAIQSVSLNEKSCKLNREIYEKIRFYGSISDGILLLYGYGDDELESMLSGFNRSRFSFMYAEDYTDKAGTRDIDQKVLSAYEKLYSDMRAELGLLDQPA